MSLHAGGTSRAWGKVERMRRLLSTLAFALIPLAAGCQSSPAGPQNTAAAAANDPAQSEKTKHQTAITNILKRGGFVLVDIEDLQKPVVFADLHGFYKPAAALDSLAPLTKLRELNLHGASFSDADLERLRGLPNLRILNLSGTKITDAGLAVLQTLPNLQVLNLNETRISNAGLQYLRGMPNLQNLMLYGTKVSDDGLAQLQSVQTLQKLLLGGSRSITDRGMASVGAMSQLRDLTLLSTGVTDSAIEDLKIASSQLKITR